ncbi:hypothetical protein RFI_21258 [Reticulomyxa filosa]|uniref:Kelch motif family protein n=1 Tax=Reticulomyxa filosa TaxID=46433 RepID=X6MR11_RETFI|nr:hypothetical protein RFI_21258 [Reticulomyxa filosa]|eukprot:ETO16101.1 hypothetical protein RFI_21258 [Reticulomyxa filosa]
MKSNTAPTSFFQPLASLYTPFYQSQCVVYKNEILICGVKHKKDCYSYHTVKNQYRHICSYPTSAKLNGHCVIKLVSDNPKYVTLLSFGGTKNKKHTLIMNYVSVWDDDNCNDGMKSEQTKNLNQWIPFVDKKKYRISIGIKQSDFSRIRALIGGKENNLLFITYYPNNIDVFDLENGRHVCNTTLPIGSGKISNHCFVSKTKTEMLLFCKDIGLSIVYEEEEEDCSFRFDRLYVCSTIRALDRYAYVSIGDVILFFGGYIDFDIGASKTVHKYSITEDKWMQFEHTLPVAMSDCFGLSYGNEDNTYVHIIGGHDGISPLTTHWKTSVIQWMNEETEKERKWINDEKEREKIEQTRIELTKISNNFQINVLRVGFFFFLNGNGKINTHTHTHTKRRKEIDMIIKHWNRILFIKKGWIDDFNVIISQYILVTFFFFFCNMMLAFEKQSKKGKKKKKNKHS